MSGHYEVQEGEYVETSENLKDIIEEQLEKEQLSKPGGEEERLRREEEDRKQREEELLTLMCDLDGGLSLMLDRVKQTIASSKDASLFLKKRAQMEDEYARNLIKLSASFIDVPGDEGKQGSYKENWIRVLKVNEQVGQARLRFAASLLEASDGLANLAKETERNRKNLKESNVRLEKQLQENEQALDKSKQKYEQSSEDWERVLIQRGPVDPNAPTPLPTSGGPPRPLKSLFGKSKSPEQLQRMEEEARYKANMANETYKAQLRTVNQSRQEYYGYTLPKVMRGLLESAGEADAGLKYQLARFAYQWESTVSAEGNAVLPPPHSGQKGVRALVDSIDPKNDLVTFVQLYTAPTKHMTMTKTAPPTMTTAMTVGRRSQELVSDVPYNAYILSPHAMSIANPKPIFGVDLLAQLRRDGLQVPVILVKCARFVEDYGLDNQGIYRMSGLQQKVKALKHAFDRDYISVDLQQDEYMADIHAVTGTLKLYFRELPSPLFPPNTHADLIKAARDEPNGVAIIQHLFTQLPTETLATIHVLFAHLHKVEQKNEINLMTSNNLGIVWGPTLMPSNDPMADMSGGNVVVERLLDNYDLLFE